MPSTNLAYANERREDRAEVHYRTSAMVTGGKRVGMLVVNISANGLMARCDTALAVGDALMVQLPDLPARAVVRWALGGRIGCEFERSIPAGPYFAMLPRLR